LPAEEEDMINSAIFSRELPKKFLNIRQVEIVMVPATKKMPKNYPIKAVSGFLKNRG